jgi:hypothetical protein
MYLSLSLTIQTLILAIEIYFASLNFQKIYLLCICIISLICSLIILLIRFNKNKRIIHIMLLSCIVIKNIALIEFETLHNKFSNIAIAAIIFFCKIEYDIFKNKIVYFSLLILSWIYYQIRISFVDLDFQYDYIKSIIFLTLISLLIIRKKKKQYYE